MSRVTRLRSGRQIPLHGYTREHLSTRVRRAYREEVDRTHRSLLNAALAFAERVEAEIRTTMLLTGSPTLAALRRAPRVLLGELSEWLRQESSG